MIKIVVDCFGGDNSPIANIDGALEALKLDKSFNVVLAGDEDIIKKHLEGKEYDKERIEFLDAKEVITCEEQPTEAVKKKQNSSLVKGCMALNDGADAFVSTGSTGALLVGCTLKVGRIRGVSRPALLPVLPTLKGGEVVMLDVGANADCKPQYLFHFALMGTVYAKEVLGIQNPRVALLSNGTEDAKGNELIKQVNYAFRHCPEINFVGNIEARDIISGDCDVVVTDGFSGNIAIKAMEGISSGIFTVLKQSVSRSFKSKIGALLMKKSLREVKNTLDYNKKGGAVFIGAKKVVIKAHGSSKASAITAAILQASNACKHNIVELIKEKIDNTPVPPFGEEGNV